jgi:ABC-type nitrate/sulfonate/bicarbonate transport system substrate-binding protein
MNRPRRTGRAIAASLVVSVAGLAACGDDSDSSTTTVAGSATAPTSAGSAPSTTTAAGVSAQGISPERCAANRKAGKITYLSGFDFAAAAGIVDAVMAKEKGYFDKMCLEVEIRSSFSTANYPLVAANQAQFASAGSYVEMLTFNKDGADLVAVVHDGKVGVDALLFKPENGIKTLADLKGKTIGVKGALPPSQVAMLAKAGVKHKVDTKEVLLDGFDPKAHWKMPIDALPVYKSNEPGQLDAAGVTYGVFDPAKEGIPASFGVIYTNRKFLTEHPTAAQDFVRATRKGMADAIANPDEAVTISFKLITAGGNKNFLSDAGERYRWKVESKIVADSTPKGQGVGVVDGADLLEQVDVYLAAGVFSTRPKTDGTFDEALGKGVFDADGTLIWPTS